MDAVQPANSGHPGTPMAMAPVAYTLWQQLLRFDPDDPIWPNRDRFVLSMGHASMLLYSMLHLTRVKAVNAKYETARRAVGHARRHQEVPPARQQVPGPPRVPLDVAASRRRPARSGRASPPASAWRSRASGWRPTSTGPDFEMFDYDVYALCGDGCMMEGVSGEAASLAGHLKLDNLCWIYDNNKITIEGNTEWAFSEDVATRFIAYGWNVTRVGDANDLDDARARLQHVPSARPTARRSSSSTATSPGARRTSRTRTPPTASRSARRRSRLTKQFYGWPRGREVPRSRRRLRPLQERHRQARRRGARRRG